ncbi:hypothetical protein [Clostridium sp. SM-530-WT-3G]|uniref:hypothetical protein n=1 Tax=Clostridium sp. SM-530-WT-3G TaxID=2725303 RepID=UPI00145F95DB|nr:hypothetical protein [Clostridium sp. SM-530-WT-3G]NME82706.1 hypothetical protein [Clostridium sp. SM-530-WT-3G]
MSLILNYLSKFFLYSVLISAVSETIAGLLISTNEAFFITPEEEALIKIQKAVIEKELKEESEEMSKRIPGYNNIIGVYYKWAEENQVKNILVLYILCFIPIVNILVIFNNVYKVVMLFILKFKILISRFKHM